MIGVTFVFVVVTKTPFKVSLPITVPGTVAIPEPELTVTAGSITASITLIGIVVAVLILLPGVGSFSTPVIVAVLA